MNNEKYEDRDEKYKDRRGKLAEDIARTKVVLHKIEEKMTTLENSIDQLKEKLAEIRRSKGD